MIDVKKCVYEDSFANPEYDEVTHYFVYPKDMDEAKFYVDKDSNIVAMCISLTVNPYGVMIAMSPTVEDDGYRSDIDWQELSEGINYTDSDVNYLFSLVRKAEYAG